MLKRFILWDFPRATWQYDVMVGSYWRLFS